MDTKLVEDEDKTGRREVLRLGQQTKSRLKQCQTSHMVLLAAEHWLVGSDKYRLQNSQMSVGACSCQYIEKGRRVVSLRQCDQALRVCFQVSGYSWIRLVEYQWVFRSTIFITMYSCHQGQLCHPQQVCQPPSSEEHRQAKGHGSSFATQVQLRREQGAMTPVILFPPFHFYFSLLLQERRLS